MRLFSGSGPTSLLGFFYDENLFGCVLFLGLGAGAGTACAQSRWRTQRACGVRRAGILGHTLMNSVLKYLPPLIVAIMMLNEPLVGSLIGAGLGVSGLPGAWTWVRPPAPLVAARARAHAPHKASAALVRLVGWRPRAVARRRPRGVRLRQVRLRSCSHGRCAFSIYDGRPPRADGPTRRRPARAAAAS